MPRPRKPIAAVLLPLLVGVVTLSTALNKPTVAAIRAVDILSLVGAGMCFGIALVTFFSALRNRGKAPSDQPKG